MDELENIFREVFEDRELETKDLTRRNYPDWDSLAHVKIVLGIEERLGVKLTIDEVARVSSAEEFRRLIASKSHSPVR